MLDSANWQHSLWHLSVHLFNSVPLYEQQTPYGPTAICATCLSFTNNSPIHNQLTAYLLPNSPIGDIIGQARNCTLLINRPKRHKIMFLSFSGIFIRECTCGDYPRFAGYNASMLRCCNPSDHLQESPGRRDPNRVRRTPNKVFKRSSWGFRPAMSRKS